MGAGALGSVFGCLMRDGGHEVALLEPGPRLEDVRELGLRVSGLFGDHYRRDFTLHSAADEAESGRYELVLMTVKSFDTAEAARQIAPGIGPDALVVSLQNGLGNYEALRDCVGEQRALAGRVIFGAQFAGRAHVKVTVYAEPVMVGSPTNAVEMTRVAQIAQAFTAAGIPSEPTDQITGYLWAKMLYNCSLNPLSAILDVPYGRLLDSQSTRELMRQVVEEIFAVARARKVELFWREPAEYIEALFGRLIPDTAAHYASMAQDLQAGRRTEIDALNGAIVRLGEEAGIACPVNAVLTGLIQAAERLRS